MSPHRLPGTGQTESRADAPIDLASHAGTLRGAVAILGLRRYALIAHDSGGAIARLAAAENPAVTALVLGDTEIPGHHPVLVSLLLGIARVPGGAWLFALASRLRVVRRSTMFGFGGCFADLRHAEGEFDQFFVTPLLRSKRVRRAQFAVVDSLDIAFPDRLREVHQKITAPTLLIWGEADPIFPVAKARMMAEQFRGGAGIEVLAGGKAFVHEERPEDFARTAIPFLRRAFSAASPTP